MAPSLLTIQNLLDLSGVAVIGGTSISPAGGEMARLVGASVIAAGRVLVTGGRRGAGEAAAAGAAACCEEREMDPRQWVFSLVPSGENADFAIGRSIVAGENKTARRVQLVRCTTGAIVIGGGSGTADEVLISVLEAIMNGYSLIPASGTGGVADRICRRIGPFDEAILNDLTPSAEKASALVKRLLCPPCWYCDIDPVSAHDKWFFGRDARDPVAQRMYRLRHTYY